MAHTVTERLFPRIPLEIIDLILGHIDDEPDTYLWVHDEADDDPRTHGRSHTLRACSLVSKSFHAIASRYLDRNLYMSINDEGSTTNTLTKFQESPQRAKAVKRVYLSESDIDTCFFDLQSSTDITDAGRSVLNLIDGIWSFSLSSSVGASYSAPPNPTYSAIMRCIRSSNLSTLFLKSVYNVPLTLFTSLPSLVHLELDEVTYADDGGLVNNNMKQMRLNTFVCKHSTDLFVTMSSHGFISPSSISDLSVTSHSIWEVESFLNALVPCVSAVKTLDLDLGFGAIDNSSALTNLLRNIHTSKFLKFIHIVDRYHQMGLDGARTDFPLIKRWFQALRVDGTMIGYSEQKVYKGERIKEMDIRPLEDFEMEIKEMARKFLAGQSMKLNSKVNVDEEIMDDVESTLDMYNNVLKESLSPVVKRRVNGVYWVRW